MKIELSPRYVNEMGVVFTTVDELPKTVLSRFYSDVFMHVISVGESR